MSRSSTCADLKPDPARVPGRGQTEGTEILETAAGYTETEGGGPDGSGILAGGAAGGGPPGGPGGGGGGPGGAGGGGGRGGAGGGGGPSDPAHPGARSCGALRL